LTRDEARKEGLKIYFNRPCRNNHTEGRYTSNGSCVSCVKAFAINNPHVNSKAVTDYQKRNKDKVKERLQKWRKANPEKTLLQKRRYKNAEGFFTADDILTLMVKQKGCCVLCSREFSETLKKEIDHIIPISKDGSNWPSNLQLLCRNCNAKKSNKT